MSEKFRIGSVGAGRGRSYFSPFAAMAETEVIAICDLDQSALDQIGNQYLKTFSQLSIMQIK